MVQENNKVLEFIGTCQLLFCAVDIHKHHKEKHRKYIRFQQISLCKINAVETNIDLRIGVAQKGYRTKSFTPVANPLKM
jgi:hypothetical protein